MEKEEKTTIINTADSRTETENTPRKNTATGTDPTNTTAQNILRTATENTLLSGSHSQDAAGIAGQKQETTGTGYTAIKTAYETALSEDDFIRSKAQFNQLNNIGAATLSLGSDEKGQSGNLGAEQQNSLNNYLSQYENYQKRKLAIAEEYSQKIAAATSVGEKISLANQLEQEVSSLNAGIATSVSAINKLFDSMRENASLDLIAIGDKAKEVFSFIKEGEWDEKKAQDLGVSKDTFDYLQQNPDVLKNSGSAIDDVYKTADKIQSPIAKIKNGIKDMFNAGDDSKKFQEGLNLAKSGMEELQKVTGFASEALKELGDAFGNETLSTIGEGLDSALKSATSGMQAGAVFGPIGAAAGAATGLVSSLISTLSKIHDAKKEKQIKKLQEQIDTLSDSYDDLEESVQKAYSSDASQLIEQENKNLERQKELIKQQIKEEEAKKDSDKDKIKAWQEQIEEIDDTIKDNKEKQVDAIFGEDVQSAIENFAQAYADAWTNNEDRAKTASSFIKDMIKKTLMESIKADISGKNGQPGLMDNVRKKMNEFLQDDGQIDDREKEILEAMVQGKMEELDKEYAWATDYLSGDKAEEDPERTAAEKGIAQASQESVNELNGRATAIQGHTFTISEKTKELTEYTSQMLQHITNIDTNTARLSNIESNISNMRADINNIVVKGIKMR